MSEAEFCCDEGQYLADKAQFEWERKQNPYEARIVNQRTEINRLKNHINNITQSRDCWKRKAEHRQTKIESLQTQLDDKCDRCIVRDKAEAVEEFAREIINEVLPKLMYGHEEKALQIAMAISEKAQERIARK